MLDRVKTSRGIALLVALLLPLAALAQSAQSPDWAQVAAHDVVRIQTTDADGDTRTTKIWIVLVDDQPYIRTGGTRWAANLEREPVAVLHAGDAELPVRVAFVEDEDLRERVEGAFREKYGFTDRLSGIIRMGKTRIMRLESRRP